LLWSFGDGEPVINHFASMKEVPAETAAAKAMSKALKKAGFTFVGPTICYAFMQSMGLVNDHMTDCPCHPDNQR
jgi:DNA-3-methyladenine glycosylase I